MGDATLPSASELHTAPFSRGVTARAPTSDDDRTEMLGRPPVRDQTEVLGPRLADRTEVLGPRPADRTEVLGQQFLRLSTAKLIDKPRSVDSSQSDASLEDATLAFRRSAPQSGAAHEADRTVAELRRLPRNSNADTTFLLPHHGDGLPDAPPLLETPSPSVLGSFLVARPGPEPQSDMPTLAVSTPPVSESRMLRSTLVAVNLALLILILLGLFLMT